MSHIVRPAWMMLMVAPFATAAVLGVLLPPRAAAQATPAEEVRRASDQFYTALNAMFTGDLGPMREIWSHDEDVTQMGPFGKRLVGWKEVEGDFQRAASMIKSGKVVAKDVLVEATADMGYTTCVEQGENIDRDGKKIAVDHRATSIFRREGGKWKLVHHHTDLGVELQRAMQQQGGSAGTP
jgi:ketosteroid isomerase-like protein